MLHENHLSPEVAGKLNTKLQALVPQQVAPRQLSQNHRWHPHCQKHPVCVTDGRRPELEIFPRRGSPLHFQSFARACIPG